MSHGGPKARRGNFKIAIEINSLVASPGLGPRLAFYACMRVAVVAICLASTGCIVTDPYEFPEAINEPPTLASGSVGLELSRILELTPDSDPGVLSFSVIVHDPDVDEVLYARQRLLEEDPDTGKDIQTVLTECDRETDLEPEVPVSGEEDRTYEPTFRTEWIQPGTCYAFELAVSPAFQLDCAQLHLGQDFFSSPDEPGNVAVGRWYIKRTSGTGQDRVVCPSETVDGVGLGL